MTVSCDIGWFLERDVDLWLCEELRVNGDFARWFLDRAGGPADVAVPARKTQVSVMTENGETDVLALFDLPGGKTFAMLVENKITAGFQKYQLEGYLRRGSFGNEQELWDGFAVAVFAPARHPGHGSHPDVKSVTFEDAASHLDRAGQDPRTTYRARFLERAAHGKIVTLEDYEPYRIEFWDAVEDAVRRQFGTFFVLNRTAYPKTTYINPKCAGMAKYLRVDLKGNLGQVDLAFMNASFEAIEDAVRVGLPAGMRLVENGRSVAIRIDDLAPFLVADGLGAIEAAVVPAFAAAKRLLVFWKENQAAFDRIMRNA